MSVIDTGSFYQVRVILTKDSETGQIVAEVPSLSIADYGIDSQEALNRLQDMLMFHLECLQAEGKPIPPAETEGEGLYLRVRLPVGAA